MTTQSFTEEQLKARLKERLEAGTMTREQAAQAVAAFRAQQQATTQQPIAQAQQVAEPEDRGFLGRVADFSSGISNQINRSVAGVGESILGVGSAAIAEPIAGLAGIGAMIPGGRSPVEAIEDTREALTYQPRTQAGQQAMGELSGALAPVGEALSAVEDVTGEAGYRVGGLFGDQGAAIGGAIGATIPTAVAEIIGFKGTKAAKQAALADQVRRSGVESIMTPEAITALRRAGFTDAELQNIVEVDPRQIDRLERFQAQGIQPTRGDITMDTAQRRAEQQLAETAQGESAERMRQLRVQQSQALQANFEEMIDSLGIPDDIGQSIKSAIESRKSIARQDASRAYDLLAQAQGGADNIPIIMPGFEQMPDLPSSRELRSIKRADRTNYNALQDALAEFGLSTDEAAMARLADEGVAVEPLNIKNFEELRQALNVIRRNDEAGNMSRVLEPIINELDRQVDVATYSLMTSGNPDIAEIAKDARNAWRGYKTEFDPKALTTKLIDTKPRSTLPVTEVSQVYDSVSSRSVPVEQVGRLLDSLQAEGALGNRAIGNLQASVVLDVLDSGFKGSTNKIGDSPVFSGAAMSKRFFEPAFNAKIKEVFRNNPAGYNQLEDLIRTAQDLTPGKLETVKGSGNVILDVANAIGLAKVGNIPGVNAMVEQMRDLSIRSNNRQLLNRALEARPDLKMASNDLVRSFPMLSSALGIGYLSGLEEETE